MLLLPLASQSQAIDNTPEVVEPTHAPPILVDDLPPLVCGEELCDRPLRMYDRNGREAHMEYGWWQAYGPDLDWNGMDDRLQRIMDGMESISPTAILGPDGRKTVAIVVDYAWYPTLDERDELISVLNEHGWVGTKGGAFFEVIESIDAIAVDKVPVSSLMDIYHLEGVVVIEMQNVMVPFNDVASRAALARSSADYTNTGHDRGYTGSGVIIAVLDTGVDNEHRSLNDFDDVDDDPDLDPTSYSDQKWFAGYDATSSTPDESGATDPDDNNGHGTHVAGSALGTGDSSRVHMGTGPGAGLVDVKVLSDGGGTNSQYTYRGLQWVLNNTDTNWGVNSTYNGIQIASMSYGSVGGGPLLPGNGDNGSSAEANLVNILSNEGVVCVVAIGNDGTNRVPSPASADQAITIGSVDDKNTVLRDDDILSDFSNYGPRADDGDGDSDDEEKPDITSYGSNIMSATAVAGGFTTPLPGDGGNMAGNGYDEKSGTSMATPIASGVVAMMLEADPSLTPQEVKDILRTSAEPRGAPFSSESRWNSKYGYGIIDASCAISVIKNLDCFTGLGNVQGEVNVSFPIDGAWMMANTMTRFSGDVNTTEIDYNEVEIYIEQHFPFVDENRDGLHDKPPEMLLNWTTVNGTMDYWFYDLEIPNSWVKSDDLGLLLKAVAFDGKGNESSITERVYQVSRTGISLTSPISRNVLAGTVEVTGSVEGVEHDRIEYKVDDGEWKTGTVLSKHSGPGEDGIDSWSFDWDTSEVDDGFHEFYVRMVNKSGFESPIFERTYTTDNIPPAPSLRFRGEVELFDQKLPAETAYAGSLLEVKFDVYNAGDKAATDIFVRLTAPGEESDVYPSQGLIPSLEKGETVGVTLYWQASVPGLHDVKIELDPNDAQGDLEPEDNVLTFPFEILERPSQAVLRYLPGAVTTLPNVPLAGEDYTISLRVDNLGQSNAIALEVDLAYRAPDVAGWQPIDTEKIGFVPGATIETGFETVKFTHQSKEVGAVHYRATLTGDGVESEFSQLFFTVVVSDVSSGQGTATLSLSEGESPVAFAGIETSTLLFTTVDGELHVRSMTKDLELLTDELIDQNWGGEIDVLVRNDGLVHAAWTSRTQSQQGYFLNDVAMTSFSVTGQMLPIHHHLTPLKISEGQYWGLDLAQEDDTVVLSGYFRNISTGGSWSDLTSVFSIHSSSPDSGENWTEMRMHIPNIDIHPDDGDQLATVLLDGVLHVLYQELRDDVTGIERSGLMYSRGELTATQWSYQSSIGDEAKSAQLGTLGSGDDTIFFAAWIEGTGNDAAIAVLASEGSWSEDVERTSAPGAMKLLFSPRSDMIEVVYDEITVRGEVTRYGLLTIGEVSGEEVPVIGLGNIVSEKKSLIGYSMNEQDGILFTVSPTGRYSMQKFLMDSPQEKGEAKSFLEQFLEPLPGSDEMKVKIFMGIVSILFIIFILVVISLRSSRKKEDVDDAVLTDEDEIAILVQVQDDEPEEELVASVPISGPVEVEMEEPTLADELEAKSNAGEGNARLNRRMKRKQDREIAEIVSKGMPPLPLPAELPPLPQAELPSLPLPGEAASLPPLGELPPLRRQATCPSCQANFPVTDITRAQVTCPICSERFSL